jgi:hypothetical protein
MKGESSIPLVGRRDQPGMPILARGAEPEHVVGIHEDAAAVGVCQVDPGHMVSPNSGSGQYDHVAEASGPNQLPSPREAY